MVYELKEGMIDSHFHSLEMKKKGLDPNTLLQDCLNRGLIAALDVGVKADDIEKRKQTFAGMDSILFAVGIHPGESRNEGILQHLHLLSDIITDNDVVAVGEIGLDWYRNHGTPERQKQLFIEQLALANSQQLPVIIHNRDADKDVLSIVSDNRPNTGGIMHCFSSTYEMAKRFIDLGFFISFAGNVTYKNAYSIREAAVRIPLDAILIETDAPYLSPQQRRGKPNFPGHIGYTYDCIAELRSVPVEVIIERVQKNFRSFVNR